VSFSIGDTIGDTIGDFFLTTLGSLLMLDGAIQDTGQGNAQ
jgi:hypothetical protein